MLTYIRDHTQSLVVKILAGLLIGSFAVWGVEDMFSVVTSNSSAIFLAVTTVRLAFRYSTIRNSRSARRIMFSLL